LRAGRSEDHARRDSGPPSPWNEVMPMVTPNPFERPPRALDDRPPRAMDDRPLTRPLDEPLPQPAEETAPERHEDVIARVRELLGKYPTLGSRQLYDLAVRMHPDLEQAGFRSFHARYVLPLKREKARAEGRVPKPRQPRTSPAKRTRRSRTATTEEAQRTPATTAADTTHLRTRVRAVMLRLARQVATADSRAELVDALAGVEEMVDEVMLAAQPPQPEIAPAEQE
jgi:hypothetical protein